MVRPPPIPVPLRKTDIKVTIDGGLATVRTTRCITNAEDIPIEAILTFPVGFDAVVTCCRGVIYKETYLKPTSSTERPQLDRFKKAARA